LSVVYFTDRDLGLTFPATLRAAMLAESFVRTHERIEAFLAKHSGPLIAKVYRASPKELAKDPAAIGRVERWYPQ
jgi:hypothetical protein